MDDKEESLIQHLEALRSVLVKSLTALAIGLLPMFFLVPYFMNALIKVIVGDNEIVLNYFSPMEVFLLQIKFGSFCYLPYTIMNADL